MSVETVALSSRLQLRLQEGYDEDGEPIIRTRTFSNLKTDADVSDAYDVAQEIASLQIHDLDHVRRVEEVELVSLG